MKAMIVGAGGQLGQALAATAPADAVLVTFDRASLDISDSAAVDHAVQVHRPDLVFNAAAYTAVDKAESDADTAFRINRDASAYLAEAAKKANAQLVHVSTDFVFDGSKSTAYLPDDPANPLNIYGASKLAGENAVRSQLPGALIVRTARVYSVYGNNFVKTMLRLMRERTEVRVVADQIGTPTHASSLARALWLLAGKNAGGTYHYTDAGVASWYDFAVAIQEEALSLGLLEHAVPVVPISTSDFPTPAKRPGFSLLDKTGTYAITGTANHWRSELRAMLAALRNANG